ncbi:MAG: lipoyl synthase [Pseudomonadales bacterium]|nr:lipoyl synthase [Pseudomonadales bacterium]
MANENEKTATSSGVKFVTTEGIVAIKDGIKKGAEATADIGRKPPWLRVKIGSGAKYKSVLNTVNDHNLATVCQESHCPNIGECWNHGTATIMLMGAVCTRACKFCAVDTGNPRGWLDLEEPVNAARSVGLMDLRYVVLTSVDRDDLKDGGAAHYAACIREIKRENANTAVEALTPDFNGNEESVRIVVESGLDVFAQNVETVRRLTHIVRDPRAGYEQTLSVLAHAKQIAPNVLTKTSLMLGLGETEDEIFACMDDLLEHNVDILTLGQYLRPTKHHLAIERWVTPEEFENYREIGLARGFKEVASGPLVRSSYRADRILDGNNLGLGNGDTGISRTGTSDSSAREKVDSIPIRQV